MRELHLFAGVGGGILAGALLGHHCVGAVEIDPYCREVLRARQADGSLPAFPIHNDVRTFDRRAWRGRVDVVCGGFPCTDISLAGKGAGLAGAASSLWFEMLRIVRAVEPRYVFVENVRALVRRGLGTVLGGLADLGFDAEWEVLSAAAVGACHRRERLWVLAAHPDRRRQQGERLEEPARQQCAQGHQFDGCGDAAAPVADTGCALLEEWQGTQGERALAATRGGRWWPAVGALRRADDGCADTLDRVARLRALGNAQVPLQAATAFRILVARFE